jgi:hypothetical protein
MNEVDQNRMKKLLQQALPPVVADDAERVRDLWPQMLRRLDRRPPVPWFDWALAAALLALIAFFPSAIPVFLYYL